MKHLLLSKRWFTSLLLTLVTTLSWAYDFEENGLYYNINTDETSVSLTYKSMTEFVYEGYVEIPKTTKYRGRQYNVKAIGDDAFAGCENLRGVTLPDGITSIGSYAFAGCEKLLSIEIPKNVSTINDFAFNLCPQLTTVIINSNDLLSQTYSSEKNIGTIFGSQVEIYVIGEDVMSIGDKAFYNCANITSVGINSNAILSRTYSYSSSLKDIFGTQVKEYTIGSSVTSIGDYAFSGCTGLTSVRCLATKVPNMGNGVFYLVPQSSATLHVPFISLDAYKTAQQWKDFGTIKAVDAPDATAIALNKTEATIGLGEQEQLTATVSPARAIQSVSWTSSNPSVATVNETGLVTAVAAGTATITATTTDGTKLTATCSVGVSLSGKCGKTVYFSLSPDNILTIYGDGEMFDYQTNTPPWSECASRIKSIVLGSGVSSISTPAFRECSSLVSISVDASNTVYDSRNGCDAIIKTASNSLILGSKNTTIPNTVTSISEFAFNGCSGLTSILIPYNVTNIADNAFSGCTDLTLVTINSTSVLSYFSHYHRISDMFGDQVKKYIIGNSVKEIAPSAFSDCPNLVSVELPYALTSIGSNAFNGCASLVHIQIPNSVTSIGSEAFYNCSSLTSIEIPNGVTDIGWQVFSGCSSLVSVSIPNSVKNIYYGAFSGCSKLAFVTIPNSVTTIGNNAFRYCSSLTSIEIPNSVTSIGTSAFYDCSSLMSITIPESVTTIGENALYGCTALTSISVNANNLYYDSRNNCNALIETATNTLIRGCDNSVVPEGVTKLGVSAFRDCSGLTSINIPNSVESIGMAAFSGCSSLTSVTLNSDRIASASYNYSVEIHFGPQVTEYILGNNVKGIGDNLFFNCTNLTSVNIPNTVTSIGSQAFSGCSNLTNISIPGSVKSIGDCAFAGCSGLETISVDDGNGKYDSRNNCNAIIETSSNTLINGCKNTVIPNGVTSIAPLAFENCSGLSSVTIPESVTRIGEYAFRGCSGLPVEGGVRYADTYLVEAAYKGQNTYSIKEGTRFIGEDAFKGCSYLSSINIPESVTSVGKGAFAECPSLPVFGNLRYADTYLVEAVDKTLETYVMRNNTKFIGALAFDYCTSLTSIVIPESVRYIDAEAFSRCSVLAKVTSLVTSSNRKAVAPVKPEPGIAPDEIANLYPFNPAHPDDPTTANVDETTGVTKDNVYPEDECKAKWLAYYKKVYSNRQATSKTNTKWTNLSRNPYIMRNESQVVLKATYVAEWNQYQKSKEEYDVYSKYETIPTPQVSETGIFETGIPSQATLYVYEDVIDAYRITSPWSEFGQILPIDPLAVEELKSDKDATFDENAPIYDLMGRRLQQKPASGYYIQGGKKFFVK